MESKADIYFKTAKEKFRIRDVEGAIQELDKAIQINPNNTEYILLRGDYLFRLDKHKLACDDFTKVIESNNDVDDLEVAYGWRAHCYEYLGKINEAIADVDWQIAHGFVTEVLLAWRASLETKIGNIEETISSFTLAHEMRPDVEDFLLKRAHAYYAAKKYRESLDDLNEILTFKERLFPTYLAAVYLWRAKAHYRLGMMSEALSDFNDDMRFSGKETFTDISDCIKMLEQGD